jgi:hypothetical protein
MSRYTRFFRRIRAVRLAPALGGVAICASVARAQQAVPVRELSAADARTSTYFGNIFGMRALNGGRVLVNDGVRRQLVVLDGTLSNPVVVIDSVAVGGQGYGPRAQPLIPYLADSSLFVDGTALSLLVIDPTGNISHVMSAPRPNDLRLLAGSASGVDAQGNLVYRGTLQIGAAGGRNGGFGGGAGPGSAPVPGQPLPTIQVSDSAPLLRANFDTRKVDTIGRLKVQSGNRPNMMMDASGKMALKLIINPINTVDEWSVLSDGTIALVRGHDYHVDLIAPDGTASSAPKLPFDWKRLTDEDKQALIDSARAVQEKAVADAKASAANPAAAAQAGQEAMLSGLMASMGGGMGGGGGPPGGGGGFGGGGGPPGGFGGGGGPPGGGGRDGGPGGPPGAGGGLGSITVEYVPLKEIADYYPAIRIGAAKADLDGNLWVLPTTSAQSKAGELVYDVINNKGALTHRVRLPVGRSIAGFGHKGIVYLMYKDGTKGWALERTTVVGAERAIP